MTAATVSTGTSALGVAFLIDPTGVIQRNILESGGDLWIKLRGDFVLDAGTPARAIDAEFLRADLDATGTNPGTGDHPIDSPYGVQGGLFESWFVATKG